MDKNELVIKHFVSYKRKQIKLNILIIILGIFFPLSFFTIYLNFDFCKEDSIEKIFQEIIIAIIKSSKIIFLYILPICIGLFLICYIPINLILKSIIKDIKDIDF
jgi:hypothetical protein